VVDVDPRNVGGTTYANQLLGAYTTMQKPNPENLQKHHSNDLVTFVKQCQRSGEKVIVAGDFNEVIGIETRGMTRLCSECNLRDPILHYHGRRDFSTYNRGSTIIDYILMYESLLLTID
jgi:hypothetical protein